MLHSSLRNWILTIISDRDGRRIHIFITIFIIFRALQGELVNHFATEQHPENQEQIQFLQMFWEQSYIHIIHHHDRRTTPVIFYNTTTTIRNNLCLISPLLAPHHFSTSEAESGPTAILPTTSPRDLSSASLSETATSCSSNVKVLLLLYLCMNTIQFHATTYHWPTCSSSLYPPHLSPTMPIRILFHSQYVSKD